MAYSAITNFLHRTTRATIGDNLTIDVLIDYETNYKSNATQYPVEDGFPVADHVTREPITLSMTALFTPSSLLSPNPNKLENVQAAIEAIYKAGEPVTVVLPSAIYPNMLLTSAPLPRNVQNGICYKCNLQFTQVRRVTARTEDIPEDSASEEAKGSAGTTETDAGNASQTEIGTGVILASDSIDTSAADYTAAGQIQTGKEITAQTATNAIKNTIAGNILSGVLF